MPHAAGATALEGEHMAREATGDEDMKIACIGPAGENAVVYSCVNTDWSRNAGRIGIGAVMGSKNLKAVAVRGSRDLPGDGAVNHTAEQLQTHTEEGARGLVHGR